MPSLYICTLNRPIISSSGLQRVSLLERGHVPRCRSLPCSRLVPLRRLTVTCKGFGDDKKTKKPTKANPPQRFVEFDEGRPQPSESGSSDFDARLAAFKTLATDDQKQRSAKALEQLTAPIDYDAPAKPSEGSSESGGWTRVVVPGFAVLLVGLFVFTSAPDLLLSGGGRGSKDADVPTLSSEEKATLESRLAEFEATLKMDPKNAEAVEGAAVIYAELGNYARAASYLEVLLKDDPKNSEAFRLLGEVEMLRGRFGQAVTAYRSALAASPSQGDIVLLKGLTDALQAANKPGEAVDALIKSREAVSAGAVGSVAGAAGSSADPVQIDLLLGKAYFAWGKPGDASAVYDRMQKDYPEDFRGFLAKGVLFQQQGRTGEAERMFTQARIRAASDGDKELVDRVAGRGASGAGDSSGAAK
eukprot:jgi/Mesvir1/1260/Mv09548-RA.1